MKEELREVEGFNGKYFVSNFGKVYSTNSGELKELKLHITKKGYARVSLSKNSKNKHLRVHRLVMFCFNPTLDTLLEVNHKDGDKLNNKLNNLEWVTGMGNIEHGMTNGKISPSLLIKEFIRLRTKVYLPLRPLP